MTVTINGTTGVAGVDGTASTPAIQGNDTNTGIFFPAADTIAFAEGGAEVMRIDSSGNVGIGTTNPSGFSSLLAVRNDAGTCASFNSTGSARINFQNIGTDSFAVAMPTGTGALAFYSSGTTERMRITSSGNLLIGRTTNAANTKLNVYGPDAISSEVTVSTGTCYLGTYSGGTGTVYFGNWVYGTTNVGFISSTGSSTTYATSSDYRLKENIAPMTGALDKVAQLKPVTYKWKVDGSDGEGFIAHELAEVCPEAVTGEKDAVDADGKPKYQGIDTSFLVATLTAAIQEQQAIITDLKSRIEALEQA